MSGRIGLASREQKIVSAKLYAQSAFATSALAAHFQFQELIGGAVREFCFVGGRERDAVEEFTAGRVRRVGVIDREHDAVDTKGQKRGEKRRLVEDAAGGEPDLIEDGARDRAFEMTDIVLKDLVDARHHHQVWLTTSGIFDEPPFL